MQTPDFFRSRIDAMINLSDPLAVLATVNLRRVPAKSPGQIGLAMTGGWRRDDGGGGLIEIAQHATG